MAVVKNKDGRTYSIKGKIKGPDGTWINYHRTKTKYKKKKEAEEVEKKIRMSIVSDFDQITFDQLATLFKERWKLQNIDETTIVTYDNYYKRHLKDSFGKYNVKDINSRMIEDWKLSMTKKTKPDGSHYAERTINNAKVIMSRYFSFAISLGYIENNPCHNVKKYIDPSKKKDPFSKIENFWEIDEFNRFISFVDDEYWRDVFQFLYETGLREGELFALTWENIFFQERKIRIRQSISPKCIEKTIGYRIKAPKNQRSYRELDMQQSLYHILIKRLNHEKNKDGFNKSYFVFGDIKPLAQSTLARNLDYYIKLSGVKRITPHGFRHSHASLLIHNKIDDSLIAERLGHTVEELRRTYSHIYEKERGDMKTKLDSIFNTNS